jgi:hypothetical protein
MKIPPWVILLLLAPAIGELLSGSAPPAEFFSPFGFLILTGLYGCGALICRELKVKWIKGLGTLLLLGCAYGILEEGIMVASFFNPNWADLGVLRGFGRWFEVNWVWAVELTIYHSLFSITIPTLLTELAYPNRKSDRWLSDRGLKVTTFIFFLDVVVGFFLFSSMMEYYPPVLQYISFAFLAVLFIFFAKGLPSDWARGGTRSMPKPRSFLILSFFAAVFSGLVFGVLPGLPGVKDFPLFVVFLGAGFVYFIIDFIKGYNWKKGSTLHLFGLVSGPVLLFILMSPIQEFDQSRIDNTSGMTLIGLIALVLLIFLWRRILARINNRGVS